MLGGGLVLGLGNLGPGVSGGSAGRWGWVGWRGCWWDIV